MNGFMFTHAYVSISYNEWRFVSIYYYTYRYFNFHLCFLFTENWWLIAFIHFFIFFQKSERESTEVTYNTVIKVQKAFERTFKIDGMNNNENTVSNNAATQTKQVSDCFLNVFFFGTIKRFQIQLPSLSFSTLFVLKFYQLRLFFLSCFSLDFKCERCKLVCGFLHCF